MADMTKRLAAFEDTIQQAVSKYWGVSGRMDSTGLDQDDGRSELRFAVWRLLASPTEYTFDYICKAIWNRARDLVRQRNTRAAKSRVALGPETQEGDRYEPWAQTELRLDLQKMLDRLREDEVRILWTVAQEGRAAARDLLGMKVSTLHRRFTEVRKRSLQVLAA